MDVFALDLVVVHPADYPFSPPQVKVCNCTNEAELFRKLQQVCPDVACWRPHDVHNAEGLNLCHLVLGMDEWSPACLVPSKLLKFITIFKNRLVQGLSFTEAYPICISESIPDLRVSGRSGSALIVFGSNAESLPPSKDKGPQFVLLMDPLYNEYGDMPMHIWYGDETTYFALGAPWCFKDSESWETMKKLLSELETKGYTSITAYQKGIHMKMPHGIPVEPYVCASYGGTNVVTPADYGG